MEKKILAILFLIGLIIYAFIQMIPFIIGFSVLTGLIFLIKRSYDKNPKGYASLGSILLGPLLLLSWAYIGFLAYTNLYYNTYTLTTEYDINDIFDGEVFFAKNDEEAIVKVWNDAITSGEIESYVNEYGDEYRYYWPKTRIYNWTKDDIVDLYTYNIDSLCCDKSKYGLKPYDLFEY